MQKPRKWSKIHEDGVDIAKKHARKRAAWKAYHNLQRAVQKNGFGKRRANLTIPEIFKSASFLHDF